MERKQTKLYRVLHLHDGRVFDFSTAAQVADHLFVLANFDLGKHPVYKDGRRWRLPKGNWLMSTADYAAALEAF